MQTHEGFIQQVAALARDRASPEDRAALDAIKLVYGSGPAGTRGVTFYRTWKNGHPEPVPFVEVCAFGENDWIQLAGTTLHELAHVLAGFEAAHGPGWRKACAALGLRRAEAGGQSYSLAAFEPDMRLAIAALERPGDGAPERLPAINGKPLGVKPKPCGAGIGSRGGKSRGPGSGSRLVKVACPECGYVARVSRKWLDSAGAPHCPQHAAMVEA